MSSEEQSEQEETEEREERDEDIRYFVRVGTTDLDGTESVETALTGMDGIGRRASKTIAREV
ncbi:MAG: 30S ribosomal protein S13, partial [Halobacteria archaeon]|nr:30S ribosomal protein S13 [Halobacteria archaeon]